MLASDLHYPVYANAILISDDLKENDSDKRINFHVFLSFQIRKAYVSNSIWMIQLSCQYFYSSYFFIFFTLTLTFVGCLYMLLLLLLLDESNDSSKMYL